jgi:RNA polymerase sigma-70 factor (ECF subfamily)
MDIIEPTDEQLAISVQNGDREAFGALVERYEAKLLRYGKKFLSTHEDIQDMVQDIFISAYKNIKSFDPKQKFSPWIYRIAHNAFVNGLRSKIRNPLLLFDLDTLVSHPIYEDPAEKERELADMKKMIDIGLEKIPDKYREALILYYLEELSYQEIADVLHIPISTVGVRIRRGKEALRKAYEKLNLHYDGK